MEPRHLNPPDILSRLALIENYLRYNTMDFYVPMRISTGLRTVNIINAQVEASQMLKHVGLTSCTPVVTFTHTEESVAGKVNLDNSDNVFIDINERYIRHPEKVLAIMAHEICHKVLFVHGLYYSDKTMSLENELLTDLATIYVGFGKLSLNGCYNKTQNTVQTGIETITTTHTETVGYLTLYTFAAAYDIVCTRFNISQSDRLQGLNEFARNKLKQIQPFHLKQLSTKDIKETLKTVQEKESTDSVYKNILVLESMLSQIKRQIRGRHAELYNGLISPFNFTDENLSRQQLFATEAISKYGTVNKKFHRINAKLSKLVKDVLIQDTVSIDIDEISDILKNLECPVCGFKKHDALTESKKPTLFKCPKCNYHFLWDSEMQPKKKSFFHKLKKSK